MNSRFDWQLEPQVDAGVSGEISRALNVSPLIAQLLAQRGIKDVESWTRFTTPSLENLHNPYDLHDMDRAVERITTAVENGERITIYGDYDVDGLTSTTIMKEALEFLGAEPQVYLPNRFTDGYGPNQAVYERLQAAGTELLITVDNGVSGHDPIAWAMANGMDVVVTDHHELPDILPDAVAVVHPRFPGSHYPFGDLSGAGVAFKVATALLEEVPIESMDLAALGAIADVVSLTDENRIFVQMGLQLLRENPRMGLKALIKAAGVDPEHIDEQTVGFALAPRLNAIGRLGDATPGVTLLTTYDPDEAAELASKIDATNKERQQLVADIAAAAEEQALSPENQARAALVLAGENWHQGVVGIVASKIVELTGKPTVILSVDPETGTAKGSGRSVPAFHLFQGLQACSTHLNHFGGHAMAAGLSLQADEIPAFREALAAAAAEHVTGDARPPLRITARIDAANVTMATYDALQQLAPFGEGNPQPLFALTADSIDQVKAIGQDGKHLRFRVDGQFGAIAFGMGQLAPDLANAQKVKVAFALDTNTFRGNTSLQLAIKDIGLQQDDVIDLRGPSLEAQAFMQTHTYAFFDAKIMRQLTQRYHFGGPVVLATDLPAGAPDVVLVDTPANETVLASVMRTVALPVSVMFYAPASSLVDIPTRQEFGRVLQFLRTHPHFDKHQLGKLASYLHMNPGQVILAVQVFFQLKFVMIDGAFITAVDQPERHALASAPAYQAREALLTLTHQLQEASRADLRQTLLNFRR